MPTTTIGNEDTAYPTPFVHPVIETKETWADDWKQDESLEFVSGEIHASSSALSRVVVRRLYGNVKRPYSTDFANDQALDIDGWLLRVRMPDPTKDHKLVTQFVGLIETNKREVEGKDDEPAGNQTWVAYGLQRWLSRLVVSQSMFWNKSDSSTSLVDWVPAMNARDKHNIVVGNMATNVKTGDAGPATNTYYGGTLVWSHLDYLQYLVRNFIQQDSFEEDGSDVPTWTIGGQFALLGSMKTTIAMPEAASASEIIKLLVPVAYGVDWMITPVDADEEKGIAAGFEITVFSLVDADQGFGGTTSGGTGSPGAPPATLKANPNKVQVMQSGQDDKHPQKDLVSIDISDSDERRVDQVLVLGRRIVVCGTLRGSDTKAQAGSGGAGASLVPKWSTTLETKYISASATGTPAVKDKIRQQDLYRDVYQHYGAPTAWNLATALWTVACNDTGDPKLASLTNFPKGVPQFQGSVRETLSWIPLKEGYDYSADPAVDNTLTDTEPGLKPPVAWIYDPAPIDGSGARYVQCDQVGLSVHHPLHDWGVFLSASPNHKLASNHWTGAQVATTLDPPEYDYTTLVATVAIESDHRLRLAYTMPAALSAGDGSRRVVLDQMAECWVLLANTVVDLDASGNFVTSGSKLRVLRNDSDRLWLVMAGEIARYVSSRTRAQLNWRGHRPYAALLGQILTVVQQGQVQQSVGTPITSVVWTMSPPSTVVKAGYA